jgi:hypothetical protein
LRPDNAYGLSSARFAATECVASSDLATYFFTQKMYSAVYGALSVAPLFASHEGGAAPPSVSTRWMKVTLLNTPLFPKV